ncbi:MAG TPA: Hsp33 family molecular chaperone HslO [Longimicrobiales bacterium]
MQLKSDYMVRATALDGLVRAFAIDSTETVAELRRRHATDPAVTAALGRLATGTLLFGAMLKDEDQLVTVRVQGNGPAGTLLASANGNGEVRGLVSNPRPDVEQVNAKGKLNVSGVVGTEGRLTVTRDLGMRQPHTSTVELVSGEVGEDLAHYLATSEQTPSAVGIGVFVQATGDVEAAGGYIVQLMPGIPDSVASEIESVIRDLPHPTTMLRDGDSPEQMLTRIFERDLQILEHKPVRFHCPCSRERAERALLLLGPEEIRQIMAADAEKGATEVVCQFCTSVYRFTMPELEALLSSLN